MPKTKPKKKPANSQHGKKFPERARKPMPPPPNLTALKEDGELSLDAKGKPKWKTGEEGKRHLLHALPTFDPEAPPQIENTAGDSTAPEIDQLAKSADADGTGPTQAPGKMTRAQRKLAAYQLYLQGQDYRAIAEFLGVSVKTAYEDVRAALNVLPKMLVDEYRELLVQQARSAQAYLWGALERGDSFASKEVRGWAEFIAKIYGVFAPQQIDLHLRPHRDVPTDKLLDMIEEVKRLRPMPKRLLGAQKDAGGRPGSGSGSAIIETTATVGEIAKTETETDETDKTGA
jgi:hypothetical protein